MRIQSRLAALLYVAFVLGVAIFAGSAVAGNGNGNGGNSGSAPGQVKQEAPPAATPAPAPTPAATDKHAAKAEQHAAKQAAHHSAPATATTNDNSTGVKPSNTTAHHTSAPASSNKTKQYGNGKTAGQIATQAGYGDATLYGPGNSQPHKYNCGGHYVDVHALKAKGKKCGTATQQPAQQPAAAAPAQQPCTGTTTETVTTPGYVLHHTGSKTNPWVKLKYNAHSAHVTGKHADDVVVAPQTATRTVATPAGCASASTSVVTQSSQSTPATQSAGVVSATQALTGTAAPAATSTGGVLGATATLTPAKAVAKAPSRRAGGVLGATARIGSAVASRHLPFTGLPLWIFTAVAVALIIGGTLVRRHAGSGT